MWRGHFDESMLDPLIQFRGPMLKFAFDILDKLLHLPMHFFQPLPHVENHLDTGKIYAKVSRQIQNDFEPFEIFLSI